MVRLLCLVSGLLCTLSLVLGSSSPFTLTVQDKEGQPVSQATVTAFEKNGRISIMDGQCPSGNRPVFTTSADGSVVLTDLAAGTRLVVTHNVAGFAISSLEKAAEGPVRLTKWARIAIRSSANRVGEKSLFTLRYEDSRGPIAEDAVVFRHRLPTVQDEGVLVFERVKPGYVRIQPRNQFPDQSSDYHVPEGDNLELKLTAHRGVASVTGRLLAPDDLARLDRSDVRVSLQTSRDPKPWPKGLSIIERREWLAGTPEGRLSSSGHLIYTAIATADGNFTFPSVAPGRFRLTAWFFDRPPSADNGHRLYGIWDQVVNVPSPTEVPGRDFSPMQVEVNPPFLRCLAKGESLPDIRYESLSGRSISKETILGKNTAIIFFEASPDRQEELTQDFQQAEALAKIKEVEVLVVMTDDEKQMATRWLADHPLPFETGWVGAEKLNDWRTRLGPLPSLTAFAIKADGTVAGRFDSATEAVNQFSR